jgi:hypothetical protein
MYKTVETCETKFIGQSQQENKTKLVGVLDGDKINGPVHRISPEIVRIIDVWIAAHRKSLESL